MKATNRVQQEATVKGSGNLTLTLSSSEEEGFFGPPPVFHLLLLE